MGKYILMRLPRLVVIVVGIVVVVFFVMRLKGDPIYLMAGSDATQEEIDYMRKLYGLDRPLSVQFVSFFTRAIRGDFGKSLRFTGLPAMNLVLERFPATVQLAIAAMLFSLIFSLPFGIIAATRRNSILDSIVRVLALLGQAMPSFWEGIMLILIFAVSLHWLPTSGKGGLRFLILPAITLGTGSLAMQTRLIRSCLLEVLGQDYITVARAKGLNERRVLFRHALKNAAIPVVTVMGLEFAGLLTGSLITETIFAWPGVGRLVIQSINGRDYPVVQAAVVFVAVIFVVMNFLVDLLYTWLDPRVRHK